MASPQASNKFLSNNKVTGYDFDPNATSATDVAWVDMQNYCRLTVMVFHSVGADQIDTFAILANTASNGSGTDVTIKTHAGAGAATFIDAVGDYAFLEVTAAEIAQEVTDAGYDPDDYRYVSASVALGTGTDECVVTYILSDPRFASKNITADYIS